MYIYIQLVNTFGFSVQIQITDPQNNVVNHVVRISFYSSPRGLRLGSGLQIVRGLITAYSTTLLIVIFGYWKDELSRFRLSLLSRLCRIIVSLYMRVPPKLIQPYA